MKLESRVIQIKMTCLKVIINSKQHLIQPYTRWFELFEHNIKFSHFKSMYIYIHIHIHIVIYVSLSNVFPKIAKELLFDGNHGDVLRSKLLLGVKAYDLDIQYRHFLNLNLNACSLIQSY